LRCEKNGEERQQREGMMQWAYKFVKLVICMRETAGNEFLEAREAEKSRIADMGSTSNQKEHG
jgi:hypothetical protein